MILDEFFKPNSTAVLAEDSNDIGYSGAEELSVGDPVIITGKGLEFEGATGEISDFDRQKRFVVVDLYNHGPHSFHSSDVSFNEYAGSDDEEARMYDAGEFGDDPQDRMNEQGVAENYPKHQDLSGISTDKLKEYIRYAARASDGLKSYLATQGQGNQVKRVRAELERRMKGVAEGSNQEKVEVRFSAKEYAAMSPAQKAAKQEEWQQLKQQAKMRMQNFTLIDTDKEQGVAEGYDPAEQAYYDWSQILQKDGYRNPNVSGADALELVAGDYRGPDGYVSTIRNILTYVKQNRAVLGKAVSDRKTVKDAIIDIKNKFPQLYQAAQQPQGMADGELDKFKKYTRPVTKTTPKIEKTTNPSGRTTDHVEWKVTTPTGEIHRYKSKKQAQEHFDSFGQQDMAEGHGNYAGDQPVNLGGVSMKKIQIGDTVRYIDQTAQVVDMSRDREHARITIPSSATTKTVLTSDLRQLGRGVSEGNDQQLSVQQLATISDEALDNAYGYGRSSPGNTFGWQANLKSAAYAKQMIDRGATDIEAISDAIHQGWNTTAKAFVQNPEQFDDTEKLRAAGKLEAKLQQRAKLMNIDYDQLPDDEQEKDRVVARALLQALTGRQDAATDNKQLDELSPATLARYKTKAGAAATAADSAGDRKTGDRRFSGIVKATKKQFDQDAKQSAQAVHESRLRLMASIIKTQ